MTSVFVFEDAGWHKFLSYDHVFSFCSNPADSHTQDYMSEADIELLGEEEFQCMMNYLQNRQFENAFVYRGVDLLWCFKKSFFEFVYSVRYHYETFKKLIEKHKSGHFYLANRDEFFQYPSLARIIQASPLRQYSNIHIIEDDVELGAKEVRKCGSVRRIPWPSFLFVGKFNQCRTAIFSDYEKSKNVLSKVKDQGCVLFSNSRAPRTALRAIKNKAALYQIAYPAKVASFYQGKAEAFLMSLREQRFFSDYRLGELDGGMLLEAETTRLFRTSLPRLLFEIDHLHKFFREVTALRSVLLDEDVNPSKNACCQVARQYRVASFVEMHGALGDKKGVLPLTADQIFVWGRAQRDKLVGWGCPEDRVVVSGSSRYGPYQRLDTKKVRNEVAKRYRLDPSQTIMLIGFLSTTINRGRLVFEDKIHRNICSALDVVGDIVSHIRSVQVLIKVHPGDKNVTFFMEWIHKKALGQRVVVVEKYDPLLLAKAADFLVVYASTYAVDGFALGKPVVCLHDDQWHLLEEFRRFPVFYYAHNQEQLRDVVLRLIRNEQVRIGSWREARGECLNENKMDPADIITSYLTSCPSTHGALHERIKRC